MNAWKTAVSGWPTALAQVANSTVAGEEVLAYFSQLGDVSQVWVHTPGWVSRIESSSQAALVVSVPFDRVSRVVELYHERGYEARVEIDAEGYTQASGDGTTRLLKTSYLLTPQTPDETGLLQHFVASIRRTR